MTVEVTGSATGAGAEVAPGVADPGRPGRALPAWAGPGLGRSLAGVVAFSAAVAVLGPQVARGGSDLLLMTLWLVHIISATGYRWVYAVAGRFSFAQTLMMALGAYTSAWVTGEMGAAWTPVGLVAAVAGVALVGGAVGWVARRSDGFAFAIVTLALAELGRQVLSHTEGFSGRNGNLVGIEPLQLAGRAYVTDEDVLTVLVWVVAAVLALAMAIERSPVRRQALAARTNGPVAAGLGVPVERVRLAVFVLGCATGALAGAVMGHWQGFVGTDSFGLDLAIGLLLMVQLGGSRTPWGPVLGATVYVWLPEALSGLEEYRAAAYGVLLLVTVLVLPDGLTGLPATIRQRLRRGSAS